MNGSVKGNLIVSQQMEMETRDIINLIKKHKEEIFNELSKIPRRKGDYAVELSFASKLIHTIDNNQPIYDSRIAKIFDIKSNYDIKDINERINDRLAMYNLLKRKFNEILTSQEARELIKDFKEELKVNIGDVKMLDFILWQLGDIIIK